MASTTQMNHGVVKLPVAEVEAVAHARRDSALSGEAPLKFVTLSNATDRTTFFEAIRAQLPQDPPLRSNNSWDALVDSVSGGLIVEDEIDFFIVLWETYSAWDPAMLVDRDTALSCLEDILYRLTFSKENGRSNKQLLIYIGI